MKKSWLEKLETRREDSRDARSVKTHHERLTKHDLQTIQIGNKADRASRISKFWTHNTLSIAFLMSAMIFCFTPWFTYAEPFSFRSGFFRLALGFALGLTVPYGVVLLGCRLQSIFRKRSHKLIAKMSPRRYRTGYSDRNGFGPLYAIEPRNLYEEMVHTAHGGLANLKVTVSITLLGALAATVAVIGFALFYTPEGQSFFTSPASRACESLILVGFSGWLSIEAAMCFCAAPERFMPIRPEAKSDF